jgi:hypothetical protein
MNTTTPRFTRTTARGSELSLAEPLPSIVATLDEIAERVEQHQKVGARVRELQAKRVEAIRNLEVARAADERTRADAAAKNKPLPRARKAAGVGKTIEGIDDELSAFENALLQSADNLLAASMSHLRTALANGVEELKREVQRTNELRAALDRSLHRQQTLAGEIAWVESVNGGGGRVEPYRELAFDQEAGHVRARLREVFDELDWKRAKRAEEAERIRQWEAENAQSWAAQEENARKQAEESRVVYEGMKVVERGGRPVGPASGFQDGEDER